MCGIGAFSGRKRLSKEQALIAVNKMKILGLYNESRGSHGCGLYINRSIYKGIEDFTSKKDTKLFNKFLADPEFIWPRLDTTIGNTMIIHTRQATIGTHTEANTHPFRVHSEDPINDIVGVHNGTIDNIWELCKKHNFDYLDKHVRVDSHALYYLIDQVGLDVLTQYRGAAALVWSKPSDPHTLMVYHGLSKKDRVDQKIYIERPLFYLKTAEGIFFSSLKSSLDAIRESDKQEVFEVKCNQVIKVTDGEFTKDVVEIDRIEANIIYAEPIYNQPQAGVQQGHTSVQGFGGHRNSTFRNLREAVQNKHNNQSGISKALGTPKTSLVWKETKPAKALAAKDQEVIFFWKGRYHRSAGDNLCNGLMYIGERGIVSAEGEKNARPYWFFHGVMMRSVQAWEELVIEGNMPNSWTNSLSSNYAYDISRFAAHPVTHLTSESVDADPFFKYSWYFDERRVTCKLRPEFSGRCYDIEEGFLKKIIGSNGNDKKTTEDQDVESTGTEDDFMMDGVNYPSSNIPTLTCDDNSCSPNAVPWRSDTSVFDIVFADIKVVCEILSSKEVEAMAAFQEDQLKKDGLAHDSQTVQGEMWTAVRTGCAAGKSIRQALGDKTSVLEAYLAILDEEKRVCENPPSIRKVQSDLPFEVDSIEEMMAAGESVMNSMQNEYARYSERDNLPEDNPFPNNLSEIVANGSFHVVEVDAKEEIDEPLIDMAVAEDARRKIDPGFHRVQQKHLDEEYQLVTAIKTAEQVVNVLGELSTNTEELSVSENDFAQDVCQTLQHGLGSLKANLVEVFDNYHQEGLVKALMLEVNV